MNPIMKKDRGAALGLVLIFITILGVWIGAILLVTQVTTSGNAVLAKQSAQSSDVAKATAAAIAQLKHDLSAGLPAAGVQTNCNLPTTSVTTVTVTCTPIAVTNGATPGAVITTATTGTTPGVDFGTQITGPFTFDNTVQTLSSSLIVDPAASLSQSSCLTTACVSNGASVTASIPSVLTATVGSFYSQSVGGNGGTAPYTFAISGSLPAGLSNSSGVISGTPTTAGNYPLSVVATDSNGTTSPSAPFTLVVSAAAVSPTVNVVLPSPNATVGQCYSSSVLGQSVPGSSNYTYVVNGSLPVGLSLNSSTGAITGTPTGAGSTVTFSVTDNTNHVTVTSGSFTFIVSPAITTLSLTTPTSGLSSTVQLPYSLTVSAGGGVGTRTFAASNLPTGLTINTSTGQISGTPTVTNSETQSTVTVTDSAATPVTKSATFVITVSAASYVDSLALITPTTGLTVYKNLNYALRLPVVSGFGTLTYSATGLPSGLTIDSTGAITGKATSSGSSSVKVTVQDSNPAGSQTATASFSLTVSSSGSSFGITTPTTASGVVRQYLQVGLSVTAIPTTGTNLYSYSGTLPAGLTFNTATGVISGSPTTAGTNGSLTLKVTNGSTTKTSNSFTIAVSAAPTSLSVSTPTSGLTATGGQLFQSELGASGGTGTLRFSLNSSISSSGLTINPANGSISCTASSSYSTTKTYSGLSISVTDGTSTKTTSTFTLSVLPAVSTLAVVTPIDGLSGTAGQAYQLGITATGGSCTTKTYALTNGTLPGTLKLNSSTGIISGILPNVSITTDYSGLQVTVTDSSGSMNTDTFTITVLFSDNLAIVTPTTGLTGTTNHAYQLGSTTSGGVGTTRTFTYTHSINGVKDSNGVLAGTPTNAGDYTVNESVTDGVVTARTSYIVHITSAPPEPKIDHCYQLDSQCSTDDDAFEYSHSGQHEDFYCGSDGNVHGNLHSGDYSQTDIDAINRALNPTSTDITKDRYMLPSYNSESGNYSTSSWSSCHISGGHTVQIGTEDGEIQFSGTHELVLNNSAIHIYNLNATMDTNKMTCTYTGGIQTQTPSKQADFHGTSVFVSSGLQIYKGTWDLCGPNVAYGTSKAMEFPTTTQVNTVKSREGSSRAPIAPSSTVNFNVYSGGSLHVAGNANAQNAKFYLEQNPTNPSYISGGLLAAGAHLITSSKSSFPAPNSVYSAGRVVRINITNKATGVVTSKLVYINDQSGTATPGRQTSTFLGSTK